MAENYPQQQEMVPVVEVPQVRAQVTPLGQTGVRAGQVNAIDVAQLGAMLGARGMEQAKVAALLQDLQSVTIQVWMQVLPQVLNDLREVNKARLHRVMTAINALPATTLMVQQGGFFNRLTTQQGAGPAYILRDDVIRVLVAALEDAPAV